MSLHRFARLFRPSPRSRPAARPHPSTAALPAPATAALLEALEARTLMAGDGLSAIYFNNDNFTGTSVTRIDATVNANWGGGAPDPAIAADTFSVRWAGEVLAPDAGTYTFRTTADDGVRLWMDDVLLVDQWNAAGTYTGSVTLQAGKRHHVVMEYRDVSGDASAKLEWQRPGQSTFAVVPQANLYSNQRDYPTDAGLVNVRTGFTYNSVFYQAIGDGIVDDTAALQAAMNLAVATKQTIYVPNGTYRVTSTITAGADKSQTKYILWQGQHRDNTVLRLDDADSGFQNPGAPSPVLSFHSADNGHNQAFRNALYDMTINVGKDNPGAIGVRHIDSNQGGLRDVNVRAEPSADGVRRGFRGLDFTSSWPGPGMVRDVLVEGFSYGIDIGHYQYSMTFEDITLQAQTTQAIRNGHNHLYLRNLTSRNSVPVYTDAGGDAFLVILDSTLTGTGAGTAILSNSETVVRNTVATGYSKYVDNTQSGMTDVSDPAVLLGEYSSGGKYSGLSGSATGGLNLPIEDAPELDYVAPSQWVRVDPSAADDTAAIQAAIDLASSQGKKVVYLPDTTYTISGTIEVRGGVQRIVAMDSDLNIVGPLAGTLDPVFKFTDLTSDFVILERFRGISYGGFTFAWFENNTDKTIVLQNLLPFSADYSQAYVTGPQGNGKVFIEDVSVTRWNFGNGQRVWARQFNPESGNGANVINEGATLWVLGLKTEYGQTNIITRNGGTTELLGGFLYPAGVSVPAGRPSFEIENARASLSYAEGGGNRYAIEVRETRGATTVDYSTNPFFSMPMYLGYAPAAAPATPTGLTASAYSTGRINLSWTDTTAGAAAFLLERKTGASGSWGQIAALDAGTTSFSDVLLDASTTYTYRLRSTGASGSSAYSAEASATTLAGATLTVQPVASYSFTGNVLTSSDTDANTTASSFGNGAFNNGNGAVTLGFGWSGGVRSTNVGNQNQFVYSLADAQTHGHFFQFSVTPQPGYRIDPRAVHIDAYRNGDGYLRYGVQVSTDGVNYTNLASPPFDDSTFAVTAIAPTTGTVHVRVPLWRDVAGGATSLRNEFDNVRLEAIVEPVPTAPTAPSSLAATAASSSQINLTWADNAGNESGFKIERKTGAGGSWAQIATAAANATAYSDTTAAANTTYFYRLRATNAVGDSAYSNEASATTPVATPAAPSSLAATAASSSQINLTWADNANNETGFKIERKTGAGGSWSQIATPAANVTSFNDTGLTASTQYYYRVRATNGSGDSAYSNEANATTQAAASTVVVANYQLNNVLTSSDADANSTASTFNDGPGYAGFTSYFSNARAVNTNGISSTDPSVAMSNGDYFEFTVTAAAGYVLDLSSIGFFYNRSSGGPSAVYVRSSVDNYAANLGMHSTANSTQTFAISGAAYEGLSSVTFRLIISGTNATQPNKTAWIDNVQLSAEVVPSAATPAAPSALAATAASSSQINLTWTDNANSETGFKIERKTGAGGSWSQITTTAANVTSFNDTGLTASTQYYYRVRATNGSGDSAYSNEANATTQAAPSAVAVARYDFNYALTSADTDANSTASSFSDGPGYTGATSYFSNARAVSSNTISSTDPNVALANGDYFEFTVTANAGHVLDLASLAFFYNRSSGGPAGVYIRSSVDNYAANVGVHASANSTQTFDLSGAAYQGLTSITFRLVISGTNATVAGKTAWIDAVQLNAVTTPV